MNRVYPSGVLARHRSEDPGGPHPGVKHAVVGRVRRQKGALHFVSWWQHLHEQSLPVRRPGAPPKKARGIPARGKSWVTPQNRTWVTILRSRLFVFNSFGLETVHLVRSSEVEFESCCAGKEATHETPLRQVHRRCARRTHNQRERRIGATPHRIVRSNMQEIKQRGG